MTGDRTGQDRTGHDPRGDKTGQRTGQRTRGQDRIGAVQDMGQDRTGDMTKKTKQKTH